MSGEVGRKLLNEVESVSLDKLLISIKQRTHEKDLLHIPTLDRLILPRYLKAPIIEIVSANAASGKTHILYHIAALSTLPAAYKGVDLNGKGATVVVFDSDCRFNISRLYDVMKTHITTCLNQHNKSHISHEEISLIIQSAMMHIHLYYPKSSRQLIKMLQGLPEYLLYTSGHYSGHRRLDAVLVDSISAFYWQDKNIELHTIQETAFGYAETYAKIAEYLKAITLHFGAFIVVSNRGLISSQSWLQPLGGLPRIPDFPSTKTSLSTYCDPRSVIRPHLPHAWNKLIDVRINVGREAVACFANGMCIIDALKQKDCQKGLDKFLGWLDTTHYRSDIQEVYDGEEISFHYEIGERGFLFL